MDSQGWPWTLVESKPVRSGPHGLWCTAVDTAWRSTDQEVGCSSPSGRADDDETDPRLGPVGGRACWLSAAPPRRLFRRRHRSFLRWLGGHLDRHLARISMPLALRSSRVMSPQRATSSRVRVTQASTMLSRLS